MKNLPKRIWLQADPNDLEPEEFAAIDFDELEEVTWCDTHQYDNDVAYVLETNVNRLENLYQNHGVFVQKNFSAINDWKAPLRHLASEIEEAIESGEKEEFADMLLLLLSAFRLRFGNQHTDYLLKMAEDKMMVNKKREWGTSNEEGFQEHIK